MSTATREQIQTITLQCMEIWGGNRAIESAVSVPGIDAWVVSQPHAGSDAGGDIHYVSMCGAGRISRFVIADVAGHGDPVGKLADTLRSLMRKHINTLDQTKFIRTLNREFSTLSTESIFATALLATYYAPNDHLIICNAGHPPPLWYRTKKRTWQWLVHDAPENVEELSNLPLGIIDPTNYYQFAVPLEKGDLVLIYTDSLVEARSPQREPLDEKGLLELVSRLDAQDAARFCGSLLEAIADYGGGAPAEDDLTILLLHHNAADPTQPSLGEMMKVIGKMIGLIKV